MVLPGSTCGCGCSFTLINCVRPAIIGIITANIIPKIEKSLIAAINIVKGASPMLMPIKLFRCPTVCVVDSTISFREGILSTRVFHVLSWNLYSAFTSVSACE